MKLDVISTTQYLQCLFYFLLHALTTFTSHRQAPRWSVDRCSAVRAIQMDRVQNRAHEDPQLDPILSKCRPTHNLTPCLSQIYFNNFVVFPNTRVTCPTRFIILYLIVVRTLSREFKLITLHCLRPYYLMSESFDACFEVLRSG